MPWTFRKIYRILYIKKFDELRKEGVTLDKARRGANIEAIQWTTPTRRRQYVDIRNLFNRQGWSPLSK